MPNSLTKPEISRPHARGTRQAALLMTLCLTVTAVSACSNSDNPNPSEIRIGVLNPLSGSLASQGLDTLHGAEFAAEVINNGLPGATLPLSSTKGLPNLDHAKITIVKADTAGKPDQGAREAERLVNDEKVVALTGAYQSSVTKTIAQAADRLQIPMVNGESSAESLTQLNLSWFFRVGPTDKTFGEGFFGVLRDQLSKGRNARRLAVLHSDDEYGNDGARVTRELATAANAGFTMEAEVPVAPDAQDLTSHVQRVRAANPDVLFVLAYTGQANRLMDALARLAYTPTAVMAYGAGFVDPAFIDPAGPALDGMTRRVAWSADLGDRNASAKAVAEAFKNKYNAPLTDSSARSFTAVMTVAQAIDSAKSTAPDKIRDALIRTDIPGRDTIMPWDGIVFDPDNHQNIKSRGVVEQRVGQQWRLVYPPEVAQTQIAWPMASIRGNR